MSVDYREVLRVEIERLMPAHRAEMAEVEWEPQTVPEPCERCGTRVVLILWRGERRWCEVTAKGLEQRLYKRDDKERTQLLIHTPQRCAGAREALGEPTQLDLLTGEPA